MTNPAPKKLSRRDAIKLLGAAAGASVLANLPSKWSTPEIASGVLPAHAQTSLCYGLIIGVLDEGDSSLIIDFETYNNGILPVDEIGTRYSTNYRAIWECANNCIFVFFSKTTGSTATVRITSQNASFFLPWVGSFDGSDYTYFAINLSTGAYTTDPSTSPDGCLSWPL